MRKKRKPAGQWVSEEAYQEDQRRAKRLRASGAALIETSAGPMLDAEKAQFQSELDTDHGRRVKKYLEHRRRQARRQRQQPRRQWEQPEPKPKSGPVRFYNYDR